MKIENIPGTQHDENRQTGELHLLDDSGKRLGLIEYHISKNSFHVDNLINEATNSYVGVGSALMNSALKISVDSHLGFGFEIARGSELFYQTWIPRAFQEDISAKLFTRIKESMTEGNSKKLTGISCEFSHEQIRDKTKSTYINQDVNQLVKSKQAQQKPQSSLLAKSMQEVTGGNQPTSERQEQIENAKPSDSPKNLS